MGMRETYTWEEDEGGKSYHRVLHVAQGHQLDLIGFGQSDTFSTTLMSYVLFCSILIDSLFTDQSVNFPSGLIKYF